MHPGPINRGIEISSDIVDSDRSLINDQVSSGLAVRMAILYELLTSTEAGSGEALPDGPVPIGEPA